MKTIRFEITPRGRFSLSASASFLCGFTPASGSACRADGGMTFGFGLDGTFEPVGVRVREEGGRVVGVAVGSSDADAVAAQVARILSLDHDGEGWLDVGRRDPVMGSLQWRYDAVRPVLFYSPYEAACWGILAARTPMKMAARTRAALSLALGETRIVDGEEVQVFPGPEAILAAARLPSVPEVKAQRLRGIAVAALEGRLEVTRLRAMGSEAARARLRELDGVGEWTSSHVMVRGAGLADEPAFFEPRVRAGFQLAYETANEPTDAELAAASEAWRPYRTWASVILAIHLARSGAWDAPGRGAQRGAPARASKRQWAPERSLSR
ncbi:MAG TPA: hypothetical protein VL400_17465 [Polyangiaceae bacterium]|nr:hypothetical protein [Polyangiaceae bacterium]